MRPFPPSRYLPFFVALVRSARRPAASLAAQSSRTPTEESGVNARVPRYHRIAESLRDRIHAGRLTPGTRLDNQRQLAKSFGVTLMTLRQALEVLELENLIARRHGLGTFVAAPSIDYDILQLRRFAGDLSAQGEHVTTRLLGGRVARAHRPGAPALRPGARARAVQLERVPPGDRHPLSVQPPFLFTDVSA